MKLCILPHQIQNFTRGRCLGLLSREGGRTRLQKIKFSANFNMGLHVILQIQIRQFKNAKFLMWKNILTKNPLRFNLEPFCLWIAVRCMQRSLCPWTPPGPYRQAWTHSSVLAFRTQCFFLQAIPNFEPKKPNSLAWWHKFQYGCKTTNQHDQLTCSKSSSSVVKIEGYPSPTYYRKRQKCTNLINSYVHVRSWLIVTLLDPEKIRRLMT